MMNYSDYDSEDYSSNEDEDYVPSDDNLSEDDINECEKEDGLDEENQNEPGPDHVVKKKKNKSSKGLSVRKRKKGGLKLEGDDEVGAEQKEGGGKAEEEEDKSVSKPVEQDDKKQKQKADDLWASFLKDVGPRPTAQTPDSEQTTAKATLQEDSKTTIEPPQQKQKPKEPSRVTITKVFDFAGEEVLVTKEVDADSREAKTFLKMEEKVEEKQEQLTSPSQSSSSLTPGTSAKRPAGMGSILNRIGSKKQKMSTLEKSKLDWDRFKTEEGITDELAIHNRGKEGYVERKNFLERVDQRQFELEKNVRLSNMKR
ncbi:craniofacial development protein 1 isoform X2 [Salminus brasiliensis]|uniref:craniofacial development protein 1 isoform X2 n=1 Tax=Salminus brasiliensis TaxID=930266 RepID=UPI003B82D34C